MCKEVIIIGAGGHAKVICDIIRENGDKVVGFLDDSIDEGTLIMGCRVLGKTDMVLNYEKKQFIIGIGSGEVRKMFAEKYPKISYYTAIHPSAVLSQNVIIEEGTCVMAGVIINADAKIGKHCIINTSSVVEHDCSVGEYSHISPGAVLCGTVKCGRMVHVGAGAIIRNNINIEDGIVLGAGAVAVKNIIKPGTYVGIPAKKLYGDV